MALRDEFNTLMKDAMRSGDKLKLATIRMMTAALKDRDIEARGQGKEPLSDDDILGLLQKMVKQRQESQKIYEDAGRTDLAEKERDEIAIIMGFMPQQMSEDEVKAAIAAIVAETEAQSVKDMGRVMALLKERFSGRMDFAKANGHVKAALAG